MSNKPNNLQLAVAKAIKKDPASDGFDEKNSPPVENAGGPAKHTTTKADPATAKKPSAPRKLSRAATKTRSGNVYPSGCTPNLRQQRSKSKDGDRFNYKRIRASATNKRVTEKPSNNWLVRQKICGAGSLTFTKTHPALKPVAKNPHMQESVAAYFMDRIAAVEAEHGLPMPSAAKYTTIINAYPNLTKEDEQALAHERKRTQAAAEVLVKCNMKSAYGFVHSMCKFKQSFEEMLHLANIGLWTAAQRFEPGHKATFTTYAHSWIRQEILNFLVSNKSAVSLTGVAARKMMFNLTEIKKRKGLDELTGAQASEIADELGVKTSDVIAMEIALRKCDQAIDADCQIDECADDSTGEERLVAKLDAKARLERVRAALAAMPERDRDIFTSRRMGEKKERLQVLADRWKISVERVRQIEQGVLKKLQPLEFE